MHKCSKNEKNTEPEQPWVEGSGNIYKDLGFSDEESANLMARATLILEIREIVKANNWTQEEAAAALRVRQPRIAELMNMKTQCFSVDLLLKYLARLGKRVEMSVTDASQVA